MWDRTGPVVLAAAQLEGVEAIDGGDTVAVRLEAADGREIALALPRSVAAQLGRRLVNLTPAKRTAPRA